MTINSANNRVWVGDPTGSMVFDLYCPSGKKVAQIKGGAPYSAVDGSNYVP